MTAPGVPGDALAGVCPDCNVARDLHDGPDSCSDARARALLVALFGDSA